MEIHFQKHQNLKIPLPKPRQMKSRNKSSNPTKYVGVRQRPSGRWVAEIKDTTQKIRMWLGTFETAEQAARAYDEAAYLLRGSHARTNFVTHVSPNSPLASRIRKLLNNKKNTNANSNSNSSKAKKHDQELCPNTSEETTTTASSECYTTSTTADTSNNNSAESFSSDNTQTYNDDDDVYKPDLSNFVNEFDRPGHSNVEWSIDGFSFSQELLELPNNNVNIGEEELGEFERMKVERQISASLYAINGLHEYMETVYDPTEALMWDLPPLCTLLS